MHQPLGTVKNKLVNIVNIHNVESSTSKKIQDIINKSNHMFHVFHVYYSDIKILLQQLQPSLLFLRR